MTHQFFELRSLMQQAVLQERIAEAAATVVRRSADRRLDEQSLFEDRASLQDSLAEKAATLAREADRAGGTADADLLWSVVRKSRVQAMLLRAQISRRAD